MLHKTHGTLNCFEGRLRRCIQALITTVFASLTIAGKLLGWAASARKSRVGSRGAPMTVIRMARCLAVTLALGIAIAAPAASQDTLTHAKELYAGASYEEALAIL